MIKKDDNLFNTFLKELGRTHFKQMSIGLLSLVVIILGVFMIAESVRNSSNVKQVEVQHERLMDNFGLLADAVLQLTNIIGQMERRLERLEQINSIDSNASRPTDKTQQKLYLNQYGTAAEYPVFWFSRFRHLPE